MSQSSDHPHDLNQRREEFLRNFVRRGVELTEELIGENRVLQERLMALQGENSQLRAQLASDDAIRELLSTIETLERERKSLLSRSSALEGDNREKEGRYREVERDLTELASLYVAGDQLAAELEPRRVMRNIRELLEQFVGVSSFVMYRVQPGGAAAVPLLIHGRDPLDAAGIELADGPIADACLTGLCSVVQPDDRRDPQQALAVVPLVVSDCTVAVIVVYELLPHKRRWESIDHELFKLLSRRAPVSLLAATGRRRGEGLLKALETFHDDLRRDAAVEGRG